MRLRTFASTVTDAWRHFGSRRGWDIAGVLAFFLTMLLVGSAVLASYAAGVFHDGRSMIATYMKTLIGPHAAGIFTDLLDRAATDWQTVLAVAFIAVVVAAAAIYLLVRTHRIVNDVLEIEVRPAGWAWLLRWSRRLGSSLLVVLTGALLSISFTFKAALELFDYFDIPPFSEYIWWFRAVEVVLALGLATLLYGWLFRATADAKLPRASLWQGAFFAAKLYTAVQIVAAFAVIYLGGMSYYGEAAVILVLLAYIYFSAVSFLLGLEFMAVYHARTGTRLGPASAM